jgi:SAM-dependent methyltransferase
MIAKEQTTAYDPESYWSGVASEIATRSDGELVAGDDDPFFRYKRQKFVTRFLRDIDFASKVVMEVGCGPGGNLLEIAQHSSPRKLIGVDISHAMLQLAEKNLGRHRVAAELHKIDGVSLPLPDRSVDVSLTVTVLHHNTDGRSLRRLAGEICRVTDQTVVIMEDTGAADLGGVGSYVARRVDVYESVFRDGGFRLVEREYLNTMVSALWCRLNAKLFHPRGHQEGERIGALPQRVEAAFLPVTRALDEVLVEKQGLTKMVFRRAG